MTEPAGPVAAVFVVSGFADSQAGRMPAGLRVTCGRCGIVGPMPCEACAANIAEFVALVAQASREDLVDALVAVFSRSQRTEALGLWAAVFSAVHERHVSIQRRACAVLAKAQMMRETPETAALRGAAQAAYDSAARAMDKLRGAR